MEVWNLDNGVTADSAGEVDGRLRGGLSSGPDSQFGGEPNRHEKTAISGTALEVGRERGAIIDGDLVSTLPTSDPGVAGQLWSDSGVIKISEKNYYIWDGTNQPLVDDIGQYINSLDDGYIYIECEFPEIIKDGFYFFGGLSGMSFFCQSAKTPIRSLSSQPENGLLSFTAFSGSNYDYYTIDIDQTDIKTIKVYLGTALRVEVNGIEYNLTGNLDLNYPMTIGTCDSTVSLVERYTDGQDYPGGYGKYILKEFTINDGTADVLSFKDFTTSEITETVEANHGYYTTVVDHSLGAIEPYGYTIPTITTNRYIDETKKYDDWFDEVPVDLTQTPEPEQVPYLRKKDTGELWSAQNGAMRWPDDWKYPYFTEESITNLERNPDCWCYKKAMTCFSVMSEMHGFAGHATLLSPRHALIAMHIWDDWDEGDEYTQIPRPIAQSKKFWYMDMDGNSQEVTTLDYEYIGNDFAILLLSDPITIDVDYATFMTNTDIGNYDFKYSRCCYPTREGDFVIGKAQTLNKSGLPYNWEGEYGEEDYKFQLTLPSAKGYDWGVDVKYPVAGNEEFLWSDVRPDIWKLYFEDGRHSTTKEGSRVGDSSSPVFIYHGDTLFFIHLRNTGLSFNYDGNLGYGAYACKYMAGGIGGDAGKSLKSVIETGMDALDDRNGGLTHYNLVEKSK